MFPKSTTSPTTESKRECMPCFYFCKITLAMLFIVLGTFIPQQCFSNAINYKVQDSIAEYIQQTRVNLYYAMATGNSRNELLDARNNLSSAIKLLDENSDLDSIAQKKFESQIQHLSLDIESRLSIAKDNLNYKLPLYDVMYSHRNDLNTVDEYTEILVEDLCQDLLNQPSDHRSTWNIPSVYSWVVFKQDESTELYNVAIEFLSENSNQYVTQLMEYPEGFFDDSAGEKSREKINDYAKSLCSKFGIEKLYVFEFDNDALLSESSLNYRSLRVLRYNLKQNTTEPLLHINRFKTDRNAAFISACLIAMITALSTMSILLFYWRKKSKASRRKTLYQFVRLAGILILFGVLLFSVLYLGRNYGASPTSFFYEFSSICSALLYPVLLPVGLILLLRVYRTTYKQAVEHEYDLFVVYAFAFLLLYLPLICFAYFKSPDSNWWLPLTSIPGYLIAAFALAKILHRKKHHQLSMLHHWVALGAIWLSVICTTACIQIFPDTMIDFIALGISTCFPIMVTLTITGKSSENRSGLSVMSVSEDSITSFYPHLKESIEQFVNSSSTMIACVNLDRGWGKTTIKEMFGIPFLQSRKDRMVFVTNARSGKADQAGHVNLAASIRPFSVEAANIIHDPDAAKSLSWAQKITTVGLSIVSDINPSSAFDKLKQFKPEIISDELIDFLAITFSETVYWWIDDFEMLDGEAMHFLFACAQKSGETRRDDGSPVLKLIYTARPKRQIEQAKKLKLEQFLHSCSSAAIEIQPLINHGAEKKELLSHVVGKNFEAHPLSEECQESIKDLLEPFINDDALEFNLNVVDGLLNYLREEGLLEIKELSKEHYDNSSTQVKQHWELNPAIHTLDLASLIQVLNKEVNQMIHFSPEINRTIEVAAAIGTRFDVRILREAMERPHLEIMNHLHEAEKAGVIWDDPAHDYIFHFRSKTYRETFFRTPEAGSKKMTQIERDMLRITGEIAEKLYEKHPEEIHLLEFSAEQAWILKHSDLEKKRAIKFYSELIEKYDLYGLAHKRGQALERLSKLQPNSLSTYLKRVDHELNTNHTLSSSTSSEATQRIEDITGKSYEGAALGLVLMTSAYRGNRSQVDELAKIYKEICPDDAQNLDLRYEFNEIYFTADLKTDPGRKSAIEQLTVLSNKIDASSSTNLRELKGEILNAIAGIYIDRMKNSDAGIAILRERLHLFPSSEKREFMEEINQFVSYGNVSIEACKEMTWSERKGLAMALNYAVRAHFQKGQGQLPEKLSYYTILINRYFAESKGESLALSYAAWEHVRCNNWSQNLIDLIEAYFSLIKTKRIHASAVDYLNVIALAIIAKTHQSVQSESVSPSTVSSCLNRLFLLIEGAESKMQQLYFTPPGQECNLVEIIADGLKMLNEKNISPSSMGISPEHERRLCALDFRNKTVVFSTDSKLHLLRHFSEVPESLFEELINEKPELTVDDIKQKINLPGSSFIKDGPIKSIKDLEQAISKAMGTFELGMDTMSVGTDQVTGDVSYRFCFALNYEKNTPIGYEGIAQLTEERKAMVKYVDRGKTKDVPTIKLEREETSWLRFVIRISEQSNVATVITAYTGSYAPPFQNKEFWKNWALIEE